MKVVVLLSGGMDSVTAFHLAMRMPEFEVVRALSFDYGSKHNAKEIPFAAWHARSAGVCHTVIPLGFMAEHFVSGLLQGGEPIPEGHYAEESMRKTVVPFRNGIMLAVAGGLAESVGAVGVIIAAHSGDHAIYPDCRESFMAAMGEAMRLGTYADIKLVRPFIAMDKAAIVRAGASAGVDYARTWSCYVGGAKHCGACGTCVERREAFELAGVSDPTDYGSLAPLPPPPEER